MDTDFQPAISGYCSNSSAADFYQARRTGHGQHRADCSTDRASECSCGRFEGSRDSYGPGLRCCDYSSACSDEKIIMTEAHSGSLSRGERSVLASPCVGWFAKHGAVKQ
ncbi:hypothetical protein JOF49_001768 [Corynebacterium suicordis]|nr:hypothetical protein [Corynebacterium suicordis]